MIEMFIYIAICTFFLISSGTILNKKKIINLNIIFFTENIIYGFILVGFLSLVINFLFPLNQYINTLVFLLIIIFTIFKIKIFKKDLLKTILIVSFFSTLLLTNSKVYTPDASLYHIPYTSIINNEKINLGIANVHHRFGLISIVQYISAFFNNFLFKENGILLPISILASAVLINFLSKIIFYLKENNIKNIHFLYLFTIFVFITLKMSRYSEFGNDAPGHFVFLFFISKILEARTKDVDCNELLALSVFSFLNKITFIITFPITIFYIIKNIKKIKYLNSIFYISFVFFWLIKNIFTTGCLIYPISNTCINKFAWSTNSNLTINTKNAFIEASAWSKGFPDQKKFSQEMYIKNMNWFETWSKNHLLIILKKILIFISSLIFIFILLRKLNKTKSAWNLNSKKKIISLIIISFLLLIYWFFNAPVYRFGYSFLASFIAFIFIFLIYPYITNNKRNSNIIKKLVYFFLLIFILLQLPKIFKNFNKEKLSNFWPSIVKKNNNYMQIIINNEKIIISSEENCFYTKITCTYYSDLKDKIIIEKKLNYKIYINKKIN